MFRGSIVTSDVSGTCDLNAWNILRVQTLDLLFFLDRIR